ncbi:MAG: hypothetical protein ACK4NB_06170, partial [Fimbriimonadales bacterium]
MRRTVGVPADEQRRCDAILGVAKCSVSILLRPRDADATPTRPSRSVGVPTDEQRRCDAILGV